MAKKIPIGFQLYTVRGEVSKSLPNALTQLAKIGYVAAEPWGYDGKELSWMGHSAKDIRKMYDDNGLKCCGIHLATVALQENIDRTIEFNKILGNNFLIIAMDKTRMSSVAGIAELAGILNKASDKLAKLGMYSGYHAHGFDFETVEGEIAWDRLFKQTKPAVIMQMDIGNCAGGGGDPIGTLKKFTNRARSMHLKDFGGAPGSVIGEGKADWKEIFRLVETSQNTEWFVVEEGAEGGNGFDIPRRSLEALKKMGR
jgi:sugar phosphate isomerase/epimerase